MFLVQFQNKMLNNENLKINAADLTSLKGLRFFDKIYIANNKLPTLHKIKTNGKESKKKKRSIIMHRLKGIKL